MNTDKLHAATAIRLRSGRPRKISSPRTRFAVLAGGTDGGITAITAIAAGFAYNGAFYRHFAVPPLFATFGILMAVLFVVFNLLRNEYETSSYLTFAGHARRSFVVWNISFISSLACFFMTKEIGSFSRGSVLLAYTLGFLTVVCARAFVVSRVKKNAVLGKISATRVVLVGHEAEIRDFTTRFTPWMFGVDICASFVLRGAETLGDDLALATASARVLRPDDIYILVPWTENETIDACVVSLVNVPASLHLGPPRVLDHFSNASVSRVGNICSLNVVRRPFTNIDIIVKRTFDLAVALPLLVCLSPFFLAAAIAIKLESKGPVFFLQRRYGFNQETFRIVKFRSMNVAEDGRNVRQAMRSDPRVTRIGRLMRRCNLDELPQLLNVIRGEMSLVGPRPHALIHNQYYERSIADYARRHNVKPGITGWAQIHGLRGEVTTGQKMRERVAHDLYYIDNWSIGLDLHILAMTLFSPKAFDNAF